MRLRPIAIIVAAGLFMPGTYGQRNLDLGICYGITHYMGDLHRNPVEVLEFNKAIGLMLRYNHNNILSMRVQFLQGALSGSDANYPTLEAARRRNLSFRSPLYESSLQLECAFMNFGIRRQHVSRQLVSYRASAYLMAGIAGFYFNPRTLYQDEWVELQPLGTEGQGLPGYAEKYQRFQVAVPFGIGFKVKPGDRSAFGLEFGYRHTFTDYLDDVSGTYPDLRQLYRENPLAATLSCRAEDGAYAPDNPVANEQRGSKSGNDHYFFAGCTLAITLGRR